VRKRTKVLSGGERNRLALAKLLVRPSNCLLLDEPTNHLDIAAKEVLLEALQQYTGTLILVAHDRYLLDQLPEEIIEVGAGHATRYLGNYEDYLRAKAAEANGGTRPTPAAPRPTPVAREVAAKVDSVDRARTRRAAKASAQRERSLVQVERDIADKEKHLAELSSIINAADFDSSHTNPHGVFSQYAQLKKDVESLYEKLERLEQQPAEDSALCR
jgi:ATP-binding cassette subfamily F protein 3